MVESLTDRRCRAHRRSQPSVCMTGHPHSATARAAGPNEPRTVDTETPRHRDTEERLAAHNSLTHRQTTVQRTQSHWVCSLRSAPRLLPRPCRCASRFMCVQVCTCVYMCVHVCRRVYVHRDPRSRFYFETSYPWN